MAKAKITDRDRGFKALVKNMAKQSRKPTVDVGVLAEEDSRDDAFGNVQLGTVHEFGSGNGHIPERSWLRATIEENRERYRALERKLAAAVLRGKLAPETALGRLGAKIVGDIQTRIAAGIDPELEESTKERKGSDKPLIDTGQLRQSITWEVRNK